jgi:hypothetical protein
MGATIIGLFLGALAVPSSDPPATRSAETALFTIDLEELRVCEPPASGPAPSAKPPVKVWMGFAIRARARTDELFLTPRDFTLEKGGVILQARHVDLPRLPRCAPLLKPTAMRARHAARGFVLFEVPASFRDLAADAPPLILAFRPTRWGGARRVELPVPACLDACPRAPAAGRAALGGRPGSATQRR